MGDPIAGLDTDRVYCVRVAPLNRSGAVPDHLSDPVIVDVDALCEGSRAGEWVADLRCGCVFNAGHQPGTRNFQGGESLADHLGWLYAWGEPLTLVGEDVEQVRAVRRELSRIGGERAAQAKAAAELALADGETPSYRVADFAELAAARRVGPVWILDARRDDEWSRGHVDGAVHIPVHQLMDRHDEVPEGEVWVYCGSGFRAALAASILARAGREVVLIDVRFADAEVEGLAAATLHRRTPAEGSKNCRTGITAAAHDLQCTYKDVPDRARGGTE